MSTDGRCRIKGRNQSKPNRDDLLPLDSDIVEEERSGSEDDNVVLVELKLSTNPQKKIKPKKKPKKNSASVDACRIPNAFCQKPIQIVTADTKISRSGNEPGNTDGAWNNDQAWLGASTRVGSVDHPGTINQKPPTRPQIESVSTQIRQGFPLYRDSW